MTVGVLLGGGGRDVVQFVGGFVEWCRGQRGHRAPPRALRVEVREAQEHRGVAARLDPDYGCKLARYFDRV